MVLVQLAGFPSAGDRRVYEEQLSAGFHLRRLCADVSSGAVRRRSVGGHIQGIRCEVQRLHHEALRRIQQLADGILLELELDGRWAEKRSGRELANAIRNRTDIRLGLYHAFIEWFHPLYLEDKAN